ncbi:MAG: hypothetical protein AMS25_00175 [Gemmatimonas sp. SM23_52]|nr:MAG: hypothetical protein AMS25_00175 [Gemmatimonas sp. SM23_52]
MAWQFFWNVVLVGIVVLIATRVGVVLDRTAGLSIPVKWAILVGVVLAVAFFLSLLSLAEPSP